MDNVAFTRSLIKDPEVIFEAWLTFRDHIADITKKTCGSYGFFYRNCRDFRNTRTTYCWVKFIRIDDLTTKNLFRAYILIL